MVVWPGRVVLLACVFALLLATLPLAGAGAAPASRGDAGGDGYIVVLDQGDPDRVAAEHRDQHGAAIQHVYRHALRGYAARMSATAAQRVAQDSRVAYVEADGVVTTAHHCPYDGHPHCSSDPGAEEPPAEDSSQVIPWGVERVGAVNLANKGSGVHVYVIDTGVDSDHPDLQANLGNGYAVETCKGKGCLNPWDDDHGHGTHVAGTIGAIDNTRDVVGVAPGSKLHAVKVLSKSGSGTRSGVIKGIDWVAAETKSLGVATVANMSLGGSGSKSGTCSSTGFSGSDAYHQAICNATHAGVVFAVAAGNDGADAEGSVPAAYDDTVITASATTSSDDWPWWSNWGDRIATWTAYASAPVAIAAPGRDVLSTQVHGGTTTMSGTSMASPHVAGAVALYLAASGSSNDASAFANARSSLLSKAEATGGWTNTSGNVHAEPFLDARSL